MAMILVVASLAGCVAEAPADWPDREVTVDLDTALAAQDMAIAGAMLGTATLNESEFSSLVTYLAKQNLGGVLPVDQIKTFFAPDNKIYIELVPGEGAPLAGPVQLAGTVGVADNVVAVDLDSAAVAGVSVAGPVLDVVTSAINRALNDPSLGVAVDVETGEGTISLGLAQ
jgi:hypothetical protein